ncbi:MAG: hypothetical protein BGP20_05535 [Thiobacillus sp. 63-78]|nr:MAG: hypothetical protein BGP20_05535 [Thiobacillus sp. 63-78]
MQVIGDDRIHRFGGAESLGLHAHGHQQVEGGNDEMAGAAAGVEELEVLEGVWPTPELASCRGAVVQVTQVG